jgi:hypothetical protein
MGVPSESGEKVARARREKPSLFCWLVVLVLLYGVALPGNALAVQEGDANEEGILSRIKTAYFEDNKNFYSFKNLTILTIGFGIGGVMANTSIDQDFQDDYQEHAHLSLPDFFKDFGANEIALPVFASFALFGELTPDTTAGSVVGEWGRRTLRSYMVGIPPLLITQRLTGGSRPGEKGRNSSHWSPGSDVNGVSGHAFIGAVPFMTAAQMTENVYAQIALYAGSGLSAWSRVNDDKHFLSQALLGVLLAYSSTSSVNKTEKDRNIVVAPIMVKDGIGVMVGFSY